MDRRNSAIIVVAVVAIVLASALAYSMDRGEDGPVDLEVRTDLQVGDFFTQVNTDAVDGVGSTHTVTSTITAIEGPYTYVVDDVDGVTGDEHPLSSAGFVMSIMVPEGSPEDPYEMAGAETIDTAWGMVSCQVWVVDKGDEVTTLWIGEGNNVIFRNESRFVVNGTVYDSVTVLTAASIISAAEPGDHDTQGGIRTDLVPGDYIEYDRYVVSEDGESYEEYRVTVIGIGPELLEVRTESLSGSWSDTEHMSADTFLGLILPPDDLEESYTNTGTSAVLTGLGFAECGVWRLDEGDRATTMYIGPNCTVFSKETLYDHRFLEVIVPSGTSLLI